MEYNGKTYRWTVDRFKNESMSNPCETSGKPTGIYDNCHSYAPGYFVDQATAEEHATAMSKLETNMKYTYFVAEIKMKIVTKPPAPVTTVTKY